MLAVLNGAARAEEVQWRYDYNQARREAQEKGRPLLLDLGTENCFWCKKLDANTFSDSTVANLLNDKFIPLKIDANRESALANALQIHSYPTIVFAAADGKILDRLTGYKDAGEFHQLLHKVLTMAAAPEWMTRDCQEAAKALAAADHARAIALLKAILEDGQDRPVQVKAKQLLAEAEQKAAALARARQLEPRSTAVSADQAADLLRTFPAAGDVKTDARGQQRTKRARELLAQAKEDFRTQQYLCCLDRCEMLAAGFADLPEGTEAIQLASQIKNNPEWLLKAADNLSDRLGMLYLAMAETWLRKGQPDQAVQYLEKVVQAFPGSRQADAAHIRLAYLKGQTTIQAEYKSP